MSHAAATACCSRAVGDCGAAVAPTCRGVPRCEPHPNPTSDPDIRLTPQPRASASLASLVLFCKAWGQGRKARNSLKSVPPRCENLQTLSHGDRQLCRRRTEGARRILYVGPENHISEPKKSLITRYKSRSQVFAVILYYSRCQIIFLYFKSSSLY
jgi:hypothetical protein